MFLTNGLSKKGTTITTPAELETFLREFGGQSASGVSVTAGRALQQSTVYACVRILSECIASLPIKLLRKQGTSILEVDDHPAVELLATPNQWQTPHEFWQHMVTHTELRGNSYAFKNRLGNGRVGELLPFHGGSVAVDQKEDWSLEYEVANSEGRVSGTFGQNEIFHARNLGTDGFQGLSTIGLHRETIGLAIQTETHGATLFSNGAQIGTVFEFPGKLGDDVRERLQGELDSKYSGAEKAHKTMILEGGMKISSAAMSNEDAQYLQTRRFQKQGIAEIFGVPLFLLNDTEKSTTWGTGLEQLSKAFITYTLKPRISRLSQTLSREILSKAERTNHFFKFDTDDFNLADFKDKIEGLSKAVMGAIMNPNEARERLSMNPRDGGDDFLTPVNVSTGNEDEESIPTADT